MEESKLAPEISGVRRSQDALSQKTIEVAFSSPVSGHMILAFYQVSDPEGLKMKTPMQTSDPESAAKLSCAH